MKKRIVFLILPLGLLITLLNSSCTNSKPEVVPPSCDTATVRLSVEIDAILSSNCLGCHGGTASGGAGIQLENYTTIRTLALNGTLLSAITHTGSATPMPFGGGKLSDCDINKFRAWINRGAQNN
ncbi:c-type cytochrome [Foetidibacter luteolus]|uniref:c-type cytochrome n=1 Tax=Foetidibacter luteolus TaxID=2608880 RepID=UPI00129AA9DC|nr:c-type cytochrome [Foetidibacter luteolus]